MLRAVDTRKGDGIGSIFYPNFVDWGAQSRSFERLAAFRDRNFTLTGGGEPVRLNGAVASAELFTLLGVSPSLGRSFRTEEEMPARPLWIVHSKKTVLRVKTAFLVATTPVSCSK